MAKKVDYEMKVYVESHPRVVEAKEFARSEYFSKHPSSSSSSSSSSATETRKTRKEEKPLGRVVIIEDYSEKGAVITSPDGRIDPSIIARARESLAPKTIAPSYALKLTGPKDELVKFFGYVISRNTLEPLERVLGAMTVPYTKVSKSEYVLTLGGAGEKGKAEEYPNALSDSPSTVTSSIPASVPQSAPSSSQDPSPAKETDSVALRDPTYGNLIISNEKFKHLDLVAMQVDPFGVRVIGIQNRKIPPNLDDPLSTVRRLMPEDIRNIRKISHKLPILDKSMIPMFKNSKLRIAITEIYSQ